MHTYEYIHYDHITLHKFFIMSLYDILNTK